MTGPTDRFDVDLDQLLDVVAGMTRCEGDLEALLVELTARVRALHDTWDGAAELAQLEAQRRWEAGFRTMHAGLARMRGAGHSAHDHYSAAVDANSGMWDQLS